MSRKSTTKIYLARSVSILALAASCVCLTAAAQALPGFVPVHVSVDKPVVLAQAFKARRLQKKGRNNTLSSRNRTRLTKPRRSLQAKTLSKARQFNKKVSTRRTKTRAPAVGNSRLSIVGADSRFKKLGKVSRSHGFGRVQNSNTSGGQAKTSVLRKRLTKAKRPTAPVVNPHVLMKGNKINQNAGRSTGVVKFEGKPVARHLDLTGTKGNLPVRKGSNNNPGPFTLGAGIAKTVAPGRRGGKAFEVNSFDMGIEHTLVPERQRLEFLNLLGLPVRPAIPDDSGKDNPAARTHVTHTPEWTNFNETDPGVSGYYNGKIFLRPHYQLEENTTRRNHLTHDAIPTRGGIVRKPPILILDEPTAIQSKGHADSIDLLSWQGGNSPAGETSLDFVGSKAGQDKTAVIIAEDVEGEALATLVVNMPRDGQQGAPNFGPGLSDAKKSAMIVLDNGLILRGRVELEPAEAGNAVAGAAIFLGDQISATLNKDEKEDSPQMPFISNYRPQFYFRTTDVTGTPNAAAGLTTEAGTSARAIIRKPEPIILDEPDTDPGGTGEAPCDDPLKHAPGC